MAAAEAKSSFSLLVGSLFCCFTNMAAVNMEDMPAISRVKLPITINLPIIKEMTVIAIKAKNINPKNIKIYFLIFNPKEVCKLYLLTSYD
jgi:hypothetical protein